jgi:hypothetical protein
MTLPALNGIAWIAWPVALPYTGVCAAISPGNPTENLSTDFDSKSAQNPQRSAGG